MNIALPQQSETASFLYGKVAGFHADVEELRGFFTDVIAKQPSTLYFDHSVEYEGWSITSRDGTISDGVKFIAGKKKAPGEKSSPAIVPTPLCQGAVAKALERLKSLGLRYSRVRVMRLSSVNFDMRFHSDSAEGREQWRLHVPIITNSHSFFEWKLSDGHIVRTHFPADGSAWLVRVDTLHRAVNQDPSPSKRVHLLMGVKAPRAQAIVDPYVMPFAPVAPQSAATGSKKPEIAGRD